MQVKLTNRMVAILSFATALFGLAIELVTLVNFKITEQVVSIFTCVKTLSPNLRLMFLDLRIFTHYGSNGGFPLYYIDLALYFTALLGAFTFIKSHFRETRLLRFFFSIVLLSKSFSILLYLFFFTFFFSSESFSIFFFIIDLFSIAFWGFVSLSILKFLSKDRVLEYTAGNADDPNSELILKESSKTIRFIHRIIDVVVCLAVCSPAFYFYEGSLMEHFGFSTDGQLLKYAVAVSSQLVFFLFFESIFGATPGKFLTESRLVQDDGQKVSFKRVVGRTFCRFIPFDEFSFLGAGNGWHDTLSYTTVVREKRIGVSGKKYLLLIPICVLIGLGCYFGSEWISDYKSYCYMKKEYEQKVNGITEKLTKLSPSSVIVLCDVDDVVNTTNLFLKVEKVSGDNIVASVLAYDAFATYPVIEKQYSSASGMLDKITIRLSDLRKGLTPNYSDYKKENYSWLTIPHDKHKYRIEDVVEIFGPCIVSSNTGGRYGDILSLEFENKGWCADIVELKSLSGDLKWNDSLPIHIDAASGHRYSYPKFSLSASNYTEGASYKFTFALVDSLGHKQRYLVEGVDWDKTVKRIQ